MKRHNSATSIPYSILMNLVLGLSIILIPAFLIYQTDGWGVFQAAMWMFYSTLGVLWKTAKYPIKIKKRKAATISAENSGMKNCIRIRESSHSERNEAISDEMASSGVYAIKSKFLKDEIRVKVADGSLTDPETGELVTDSVVSLFQKCAKFGRNPSQALINVYSSSGLCIANYSQEFAYHNSYDGPDQIMTRITECEEADLEVSGGKAVREAAEVCMQLLKVTNNLSRKGKYSATTLLEGAIACLHYQANTAKQEFGQNGDKFHEVMKRSEIIGNVAKELILSNETG